MKAMTREDHAIFDRVLYRLNPSMTLRLYAELFCWSIKMDMKDYARMLTYRQTRELCDRQGVTSCIIAGWETALEGYDDFERGLFEQGLAGYIPKLPERYRCASNTAPR